MQVYPSAVLQSSVNTDLQVQLLQNMILETKNHMIHKSSLRDSKYDSYTATQSTYAHDSKYDSYTANQPTYTHDSKQDSYTATQPTYAHDSKQDSYTVTQPTYAHDSKYDPYTATPLNSTYDSNYNSYTANKLNTAYDSNYNSYTATKPNTAANIECASFALDIFYTNHNPSAYHLTDVPAYSHHVDGLNDTWTRQYLPTSSSYDKPLNLIFNDQQIDNTSHLRPNIPINSIQPLVLIGNHNQTPSVSFETYPSSMRHNPHERTTHDHHLNATLVHPQHASDRHAIRKCFQSHSRAIISIQVNGIAPHVTESQLYNLFVMYGPLLSICYKKSRHIGDISHAYVHYKHTEDAKVASQALNGYELNHRFIRTKLVEFKYKSKFKSLSSK